jgi:hypothetical protein
MNMPRKDGASGLLVILTEGEPDVVYMHYNPEGVKLKDVLPTGSQVYNPKFQTRNEQLQPDYDKAIEEQNAWIDDPTGKIRKAKKKDNPYTQEDLDQLSLLREDQQPTVPGLLA